MGLIANFNTNIHSQVISGFYDPIHFLAWVCELKKKENISITPQYNKETNSKKLPCYFSHRYIKQNKIIEKSSAILDRFFVIFL